jgi:hypothetical protein
LNWRALHELLHDFERLGIYPKASRASLHHRLILLRLVSGLHGWRWRGAIHGLCAIAVHGRAALLPLAI